MEEPLIAVSLASKSDKSELTTCEINLATDESMRPW
jgi:hypothetical protein